MTLSWGVTLAKHEICFKDTFEPHLLNIHIQTYHKKHLWTVSNGFRQKLHWNDFLVLLFLHIKKCGMLLKISTMKLLYTLYSRRFSRVLSWLTSIGSMEVIINWPTNVSCGVSLFLKSQLFKMGWLWHFLGWLWQSDKMVQKWVLKK